MQKKAHLLTCLVAVMLSSCKTKIPEHTQLSTPNQQQNVWTYLKVKEEEKTGNSQNLKRHIKLILSDTKTVYLEENITVESKGNNLIINGKVIPHETKNVFITEDGDIELNGYIRTFD